MASFKTNSSRDCIIIEYKAETNKTGYLAVIKYF